MVILKIIATLLLLLIPGGIPVLMAIYWRKRNEEKTERDEEGNGPFGSGTFDFYGPDLFSSRESSSMVADVNDHDDDVSNDMVLRQTCNQMDEQ